MTEVCPPSTRLSAALLADGWMNFVSSPDPIEKVCQSMIARLLVWSIVTVPVTVVIETDPDAIEPPVGLPDDEWMLRAASPAIIKNLAAILFICPSLHI